MGLLDSFKVPDVEKMHREKDIQGLIKALRHNQTVIREKAAKALGSVDDARAVQALRDYEEIQAMGRMLSAKNLHEWQNSPGGRYWGADKRDKVEQIDKASDDDNGITNKSNNNVTAVCKEETPAEITAKDYTSTALPSLATGVVYSSQKTKMIAPNNEPVLFVLQNVFSQFAPMNIRVGDLFFTPEKIHFIPYTNFISHGGLGVGVASLLGGLAGGIAASIGEKDRRNVAIEAAGKKRNIQWGMTIAERLERNDNVVSINKTEINDLAVGDTLKILRDNGSSEFGVPHLSMHAAHLKDYMSNDTLQFQSAGCAVSTSLPAPKVLLESLAANNHLSPETLTIISSNIEYLTHLWQIFECLGAKEQQAIMQSVNHLSGPFSLAFKSLKYEAVETGKELLLKSMVALIIGIMMCVYIAIPFVEGRSDEPTSPLGLFFFIAVAPTLVYGLSSIWKWYKSTRF